MTQRGRRYSRRYSAARVPTARLTWSNYMDIDSITVPSAPTYAIGRQQFFQTPEASGPANVGARVQVMNTNGYVTLINQMDVPCQYNLYIFLEPVDDDGAPFAIVDLDITDTDFLNRRGILWRRGGFLSSGDTSSNANTAQSMVTHRVSLKGGRLGNDQQLSLVYCVRAATGAGGSVLISANLSSMTTV